MLQASPELIQYHEHQKRMVIIDYNPHYKFSQLNPT